MVDSKGTRRTNEIQRIAQPAVEVLGTLISLAYWPISLLFVTYLFSGVTAVKPDEVAMIMRFGRIVGDSPSEQIHKAGLLWALPQPLDEVVRVPIGKVHEVEINDLWRSSELTTPSSMAKGSMQRRQRYTSSALSIDPETEGYCLTGDQNIVQLQLLARYRVVDPIAYALAQEDPHALLRNIVQGEMVRATGRESIDSVLTEGRKVLGNRVRATAQTRLDEVDSGLELIAVEIADFAPPVAVKRAFVDVNTAYITSHKMVVEAQRYRETELPKAESKRDQILADAQIYVANLIAEARGDGEAFEMLAAEYQKQPEVVFERLYIEGIENVVSRVGQRKFILPPINGQYEDFRMTISTK